jgi:glycosyltransferase involved in cell wall biosynthesis
LEATAPTGVTEPNFDDLVEDPSLDIYTPCLASEIGARPKVRAIAFYLPQFHPIPENDNWWGAGFTEWTKVRSASPQFPGHYQPHIPDELLGYYDLVTQPDTMRRQGELAKLHGIEGFCFYFYWFAGKRLLEQPLLNLLDDKSINLPFCLCWANENWTRRWDGKDSEILIGQKHTESDDLEFIAHLAKYIADPRYIRINDRPVLLVYRPALLPSARDTATRWRSWLREHGYGEVYLAYTQSFEMLDPRDIGFDAAIEFPPHNMGLTPVRREGSELALYDWRTMARRSFAYETPTYKLFRAVTPSWDNTARRPKDGTVLLHSSPSGFGQWLSNAANDTLKRFHEPEERLIFINAWNEWAEGAHLEPDQRYGYAWLEAARRALAPSTKPSIIVFTHDLRPHGAQFIALNLVRTLQRQLGCLVTTITPEDGPLREKFAEEGPVHIIARNDSEALQRLLKRLVHEGFNRAIINSAASAWVSPQLAEAGIIHIGLVHELPQMIAHRQLTDDLLTLNFNALCVVFPAEMVRDRDRATVGIDNWKNAVVIPQGLYKAGVLTDNAAKETARLSLATALGVPKSTRFALGVGYADTRKGIDIFVKWAAAAAHLPDLHFVWVGDVDPAIALELKELTSRARAEGAQIHQIGFSDHTMEFFAAADFYTLTSREDPFPSTALEALAAGTPVVMIEGTGGIEALAPHGCVFPITNDSHQFISTIATFTAGREERKAISQAGRDLISQKFGWANYAANVSRALGIPPPRISVIVPNYNYAAHLEQRLSSIISQTLAPHEIIFLDDASTDASVRVAERILRSCNINWRTIRNSTNSNSVFAQWRKGVELADGELIWIAEADDWADRHFLETVARPLSNPSVVISMSESCQVDASGSVLAYNYLNYVADISSEKWTKSFVAAGDAELRASLAIKNTIPNVSATIHRRETLLRAMRACSSDLETYRVAGDWCVYVNELLEGDLAFTPASLNYHRRHSGSITLARFGLPELSEIARMQRYVSRRTDVPEEIAKKADAYLKLLTQQFELRTKFPDADIELAMNGMLPTTLTTASASQHDIAQPQSPESSADVPPAI